MPKEADRFKTALISGEIDFMKLSEMTSEDRNKYLAQFVGEENAKPVNALFESKLLLKNIESGMVTWAKKVMGITPPVRRDLMSKITRLREGMQTTNQEMFLKDLVDTRLGVNVNSEESKTIVEMADKVRTLRDKVDPTTFKFPTEKDRFDYGTAHALLNEYVGNIKGKAMKLGLKDYLAHPLEILSGLSATFKSVVASMDNSFFGRQGIKTLFTNPDIWMKDFAKSWVDIGKRLIGKDPMTAIRADVISRPNALNGKYKAGGYALDVISEEAFPSQLPSKVPILGRLYQASEDAFNGGALRIRADLADRVIAVAERHGRNTLDPVEAKGLGKLVNSLTGRASIGKAEPLGKEINAVMFSIKFLKSNFDTLTAHLFDPGVSPYVKKQAAGNLLKIIGATSAILGIAEFLHPGSVELDPRSSNFGKIKIGNTRFDVTGGMASIITLASRITPTMHNGEWGFWTKSSTTGEYTKLGGKEYGAQTAMDVIDNFWQGKLAPGAGLLRDLWKEQTYQGAKLTLKGELQQLGTPMAIQNSLELLKDPNGANAVLGTIMDVLGFNVSTYGSKTQDIQNKMGITNMPSNVINEIDRLTSTGNAPSIPDLENESSIQNFKSQVSGDEYNQFINEVRSSLPGAYQSMMMNVQYMGQSDANKKKFLDSAKNQTISNLLKKYGYKKPKTKRIKIPQL